MRRLCYICILFSIAAANVVQLNEQNSQQILDAAEFSFVNFYADWCHFSQALTPIIEEVGKRLKAEIPDASKLTVAKVDCDREVKLAQTFKVNKYPTMKMFRFGQMQRREYRGQRSADAIVEFIKSQMADSIIHVNKSDGESSDSMQLPIEGDQGAVVGFFKSPESDEFKFFRKIASVMRDECKFVSVMGVQDQAEKIFFQKGQAEQKIRVNLAKVDESSLKEFVVEQCVPLVREITFQNAEELTEEGLPFFILFYQTEDAGTVDLFKSVVEKHLAHERKGVNFLIGKGSIFSHPLHHLGKTVNDLPVIAIDSFKHMYVFPYDVRESLHKHPERLGAFISDLHSGKLHREFHHGPDPTTATPPKVEVHPEPPGNKDHAPRDESTRQQQQQQQQQQHATSPPASVFKSLSPSRNRYTILRDEL